LLSAAAAILKLATSRARLQAENQKLMQIQTLLADRVMGTFTTPPTFVFANSNSAFASSSCF
jgi:hypothetical protein